MCLTNLIGDNKFKIDTSCPLNNPIRTWQGYERCTIMSCFSPASLPAARVVLLGPSLSNMTICTVPDSNDDRFLV